ncbi:hypothetical protein L207DRAFT_505862 [Hyaloscypha variabilis F]|uniref:Uncharacterized protein n=1 Tax=Hyaloscypha variabilis (strain UAMH 11265 / GT02V1 / F) TaxID=1149755 RepID=A0A2J6SDK1_HYAVF|nr:hypothetical protein L207DRAFT_505862 [Hyaloscypha variabilis F]
MHLYRSTSTLFAVSSLLSLASSLPFKFLESLARRATYSVVPVDGGSAASTTAGQGDATIYETIVVTAAPATKTIIDTDYTVSTQIVQLSGTVETVLVTVTPPAATVTTTGYSIIDVSASQVTITTTASPSSSSSATDTPSAASSSTTPSPSPAPAITSSSFLATSSHTYDNGQWHTYYPSWNASTTSIISQLPATTSVAATPTQTSLEIRPPVGPGGGYGDFEKRAMPTVIPGVYGYLGKWERTLRGRLAKLV